MTTALIIIAVIVFICTFVFVFFGDFESEIDRNRGCHTCRFDQGNDWACRDCSLFDNYPNWDPISNK
jgi:hypothetical protein